MRPWIKLLIGLVAVAAIAHVAIILIAPYVIMRGGMSEISRLG